MLTLIDIARRLISHHDWFTLIGFAYTVLDVRFILGMVIVMATVNESIEL